MSALLLDSDLSHTANVDIEVSYDFNELSLWLHKRGSHPTTIYCN